MKGTNIQRIFKVGNSLAVVLPVYLTKALKLQRGDLVKVYCVQDNVVSIVKLNEEDLPQHEIEVISIT